MASSNCARARSGLIFVSVAVSAALLLPGWAVAAPGDPPAPTVASVTAQLDALGRQTEVLAEKYNKARIDVSAAQQAAEAAEKGAASTASQFRLARGQLAAFVASRYEGGSFSNTGALLSADSGNGYLDTLNTLDLMSTQQAGVVADLSRAKSAADSARKRANDLLAIAEAKGRAVGEQRSTVAAETDRFKTLLLRLTKAQQAAYAARDAATPPQVAPTVKAQAGSPAAQAGSPAAHASNAGAQRAVDFALAQIGKPYVFGAAGPDAFDCSGLTMAAWAAGGVALPHLAASQYDYGTHVSASQLQPGDLVFLYQPIGHVSIYVGNGMVVSAPQEGENVKLVAVAYFAADFVGATRP